MNIKHQKNKERLSMGMSLLIAFCVIAMFCAISFAMAKNVKTLANEKQSQYFALPSISENFY